MGDIEILPFLEAIRQFRLDVGRDKVCYVHVTLAPLIVAEQKTKPTQHSVTELRGRGIQPDVIVVRSEQPLAEGLKRKISNLCDVPIEAVVNAADARNLYEIPLVLHEEGLDDVVCEILRLDAGDPDLSEWEILVDRIESRRPVRCSIGIIGKYVSLQDAYLSVVEALKHGGFHHGCERRDRLDPGRGGRGPARRGPAPRPRRHRDPRRVRRARHRGQDHGGAATPASTTSRASACASGSR